MDVRDVNGVHTDKVPGSRIEYDPFPGGFRIIPGLVGPAPVLNTGTDRRDDSENIGPQPTAPRRKVAKKSKTKELTTSYGNRN